MADTDVTAQTIIDNSLARAKDANKTQWADAQLLKFLNKAYDYVHKVLIREKNELAVSTGTITMVATTQEYSLETNLADFWGMVKDGVYFPSVGIPLTPCPYNDKIRAAADTTATNPTAYYLTDTVLGVINIPTTASATAYPTLYCRYFKKNTPLALATNMPYKNIFNEPLSFFMDSMAMFKAEISSEEVTAIYNALEEVTLQIIKNRIPL